MRIHRTGHDKLWLLFFNAMTNYDYQYKYNAMNNLRIYINTAMQNFDFCLLVIAGREWL